LQIVFKFPVSQVKPPVKYKEFVWETETESVVSVALITEFPAVPDWTVKVACPLEFVMGETGVIVSLPPRFEMSAMLFLWTGVLLPSKSVIVMVVVVMPSAVTAETEELTVEIKALGVGAAPHMNSIGLG
jgi:hypothetical protein